MPVPLAFKELPAHGASPVHQVERGPEVRGGEADLRDHRACLGQPGTHPEPANM